MFQKLLAILLIAGLLLQISREAAIGLWFLANREWVAEQHCVNKEEPLLMCQGKCYLQQVIKTEQDKDTPSTAKIPAPKDRMPFNALPAPRLLKAGFSSLILSGASGFYYQALHSAGLIHSLFRPPWV